VCRDSVIHQHRVITLGSERGQRGLTSGKLGFGRFSLMPFFAGLREGKANLFLGQLQLRPQQLQLQLRLQLRLG
jgi:hypothetical protein